MIRKPWVVLLSVILITALAVAGLRLTERAPVYDFQGFDELVKLITSTELAHATFHDNEHLVVLRTSGGKALYGTWTDKLDRMRMTMLIEQNSIAYDAVGQTGWQKMLSKLGLNRGR
jgi:hypothetical protein